MNVTVPLKGVIHLQFESQYQMCSALFRIQEYYESPIPEIHRKYFTVEKFMDEYAASRPHGRFTYFDDWGGFNIPGWAVHDFMNAFKGKYTEKEKAIIKAINKNVPKMERFLDRYYVIGSCDDYDVVDHEVAHALYYMDSQYQYKVDELIKESFTESAHKKMSKLLLDRGYRLDVINDEINAYLSTGAEILCGDMYKKQRVKFENLYWETRNKYIVL